MKDFGIVQNEQNDKEEEGAVDKLVGSILKPITTILL